MKLAYRIIEPEGESAPSTGASGVLLHGQGGVPIDQMVALARGSGLDGRLVVLFGDYATTASGMEVWGPCWYRSLPGGAGTDPLTLTRAVVQVSDVLADADVGLDRPVLVGWRQGAAVAAGVALHVPDAVGALVALDVPASHLALLPASLSVEDAAPAVLLVDTSSADDADIEVAGRELRRRGVVPEEWRLSDGDGNPAGDRENDDLVAGAVARFIGTATGRRVAEGSAR